MSLSGRICVLAALFALCFGCDDGGGEEGPGGDGGADTDGGGGGEGEGEGEGDGGAEPDVLRVDCLEDAECGEDEYCLLPEEAIGFEEGYCATGCRLVAGDPRGSCGERQVCDEVQRRCLPDPKCETDLDCPPEKYCDTETRDCTPGCRVFEDPLNDLCGLDNRGREQRCDPDEHTCKPLQACCEAASCTLELPSQCARRALDGVYSCFNPNPCSGRCPNGDEDCAEDQYCGEDGVCLEGCRVDDRESCPGQICDPRTHTCAPKPCDVDTDCTARQFCDFSSGDGRCLIGCRNNPDNCPGATFCNPVRQCQGDCENDQQCVDRHEEGWYCTSGGCVAPCDNDSDCPEMDSLCVEGRCVDGCAEDPAEENDDPEHATELDFGDDPLTYDSREDEFRACPEDPDFLHFTNPNAGDTVEVSIAFTHDDGDLALRVHGPGDASWASDGSEDGERVTIEDAPAGDYFIEVYGRGVDRNFYSVSVRITPGMGCRRDGVDRGEDGVPGDHDDTPAEATELDLPDLDDSTQVGARTICSGDVDWFSVRMGSRDGLTVTLFIDGNQEELPDDLDFAIYGPGAPEAGADPAFVPNEAGNDGDARFVRFHAERPNPQIQSGAYFIRVAGLDRDQVSRYRLQVTVARVAVACGADPTEPNDARNDAFDLMQRPAFVRPRIGGGVELIPGLDHEVEASLCGEGEEDWFRLTLDPGDELTATVVRHDEPPVGDSRVEIFGPGGNVGLVGLGANVENAARLPAAGQAGDYFVKVNAPVPQTQFDYTLRVNRVAGPGLCPADPLEGGGGNDLRRNASGIQPGQRHEGLTLCGATGDEDWFAFNLDAVGDVDVRLTFSNAQSNLDLDVFAEDAEESFNANDRAGHTNSDDEHVPLGNRLPGRYLIRVRSADGGNAEYSLSLSFEPRVFVCEDDPDEPNDVQLDATRLGAQPVVREEGSQWMCERIPSESDWFIVDVPANANRLFATRFLYGDDGDAYLEAYDDNGMLLATTLDISRNISKQCLWVERSDQARTLWFRIVPLFINSVLQDDERLDYSIHVLD